MVADKLSRINVGDAWRLRMDIFQQIQCISETCTIDRFATESNALLPVYNSPFLDNHTSGVDAFA